MVDNNSKLLIFSPNYKHLDEKLAVNQLIKFSKRNFQKWNREYLLSKETKQAEITITCKICLNKVPSRLMEVHSEHCMKRAETFHKLNELFTQTPKHIENVCEIKQFLVTKIKMDM